MISLFDNCCLPSLLKIFSLVWIRHYSRGKASNSGLSLVLKAIEEWEFSLSCNPIHSLYLGCCGLIRRTCDIHSPFKRRVSVAAEIRTSTFRRQANALPLSHGRGPGWGHTCTYMSLIMFIYIYVHNYMSIIMFIYILLHIKQLFLFAFIILSVLLLRFDLDWIHPVSSCYVCDGSSEWILTLPTDFRSVSNFNPSKYIEKETKCNGLHINYKERLQTWIFSGFIQVS